MNSNNPAATDSATLAAPRPSARFRSGSLDTPIGPLTVLAHDDRPEVLVAVLFRGEKLETRIRAERGPDVIARAEPQPAALLKALERYFEGDVGILDTLVVDAEGTAFQQLVWQELRRIPAGTIISYGELARRIGRPTAVRAVARANATNPVAIVVPCHRVVASDGSLHGYAGGIDKKRWLVNHEARFADPDAFALGIQIRA